MAISKDIHNLIRKDICTTCGGPAEGWKCVKCGKMSEQQDPLHQCGGGTVQPKCNGCGQAEDNCSCAKHS